MLRAPPTGGRARECLIHPDGRRIGSISGGCLEGDVAKKAWWLTEDGKPSVRVYDTSSDEDAVWEFGLGCNGVIHVLLELVDTDGARVALEFLDLCRHASKGSSAGDGDSYLCCK